MFVTFGLFEFRWLSKRLKLILVGSSYGWILFAGLYLFLSCFLSGSGEVI